MLIQENSKMQILHTLIVTYEKEREYGWNNQYKIKQTAKRKFSQTPKDIIKSI